MSAFPTLDTVLEDGKRLGEHTGTEIGKLAKLELAKSEKSRLIADHFGKIAATEPETPARYKAISDMQAEVTHDEFLEATGQKAR